MPQDIVATDNASNELQATQASVSFQPATMPSANLDYNNYTLTYDNLPDVNGVTLNCSSLQV